MSTTLPRPLRALTSSTAIDDISPNLQALNLPGEALWRVSASTRDQVISVADLNTARAHAGFQSQLVLGYTWELADEPEGPAVDTFIDDRGLAPSVDLARRLAENIFGTALLCLRTEVVHDEDLGGPQLVIEAVVGADMAAAETKRMQREFLTDFMRSADPEKTGDLVVSVRRHAATP